MLLGLLLCAATAQSQQRTPIGGIDNEEYRALIAEERALVVTADSLSGIAATLRGAFRVDTIARDAIATDIRRTERLSSETRARMARIASQINAIEELWIVENLKPDNPAEVPDEEKTNEPATRPANLAHDPWFEARLTVDQLTELRRAQRSESTLPPLAVQIRDNHRTLTALAQAHAEATTREGADTIYARFNTLRAANRALTQRLGTEWEDIFDSKTYIYNLLAERENRPELTAPFDDTASDAAPVELRNYVLQKRHLTDYEISLAHDTGNTAAVDSLRGVVKALWGAESLDDFHPVTLKERLFLDFAELTFGRQGTIPQVAVWPRGTIWRVMVGSFTSRPSTATFRGAMPLAFSLGDDGRWRYFAGGFATDSLASEAAARLKKAGLRTAVPVVWIDGEMIDPSEAGERIYRIEISGVAQLPPQVDEAITAHDGVDIARNGENFIAAPLDGVAAIRLYLTLDALKTTHPEMETRLSKKSE
jgi:hypothetical protein